MKESAYSGYIVNEKADIKKVDKDVVVIDKNGKECFRRLYNQQNISIAHAIYMGNKYEEQN